jgi:hypothetical protein
MWFIRCLSSGRLIYVSRFLDTYATCENYVTVHFSTSYSSRILATPQTLALCHSPDLTHSSVVLVVAWLSQELSVLIHSTMTVLRKGLRVGFDLVVLKLFINLVKILVGL